MNDKQIDCAISKDRITALENERAHLVTRSSALEAELDQCIKSKQEIFRPEEVSTGITETDRTHAEKLGFKPVSAAQKDDLKLISGIGPFIEKNLNKLGIYTFEQISEFSPATILRVTEAIEFFPGRIERDHWVAQARNSLQIKLN